MKLIVGLGNPESKYNFTRHNFGFLALDFYAKTHQLSWQSSDKFHADLTKNGDTIFLKPKTYYNLVGESVFSCLNYYKIPLENILIVCDDLHLPFGTTRFRKNGTHGGNNGLKSIITILKTTDFSRLRLGTENELSKNLLAKTDFVLGKFTETEKTELPKILLETSQKITDFIHNRL